MKLLRKKQPKELNGGAPNWFQLWHHEYFVPVDNRSKRTERWVTAIILIVLGSYFAGERYAPDAVEFVRSLFG